MNTGKTRDTLLLFTKPARPGRVKTRLVGDLTAHQAAAIHGAFLADLAARLCLGRYRLQLAWALDPGDDPPCEPRGIPAIRQADGDLGTRLYEALRSRDSEAAAAVGSDHPELEPAAVEDAFGRLRKEADAVFGPATDGGYYLVALRREAIVPEVFADIPWSTDAVLRVTLRRCEDLGLRVSLLSEGHDVDTPSDLADLARRLSRRPEDFCPRTRSLLASWGRMPGRPGLRPPDPTPRRGARP